MRRMQTRRQMRLFLLLSVFTTAITVYYSIVWVNEERTVSYRYMPTDQLEHNTLATKTDRIDNYTRRMADDTATMEFQGQGKVEGPRTKASFQSIGFGKTRMQLREEDIRSNRVQGKYGAVKQQTGHGFFRPPASIRRDPLPMEDKPYNGCAPLLLKRKEIYLMNNTSSYFTLRQQLLNVFIPKLLIQTREVCPEDELFLLIFVLCVTEDFSMRQAIRNTWASPLYGSPWPRKTLYRSMKIIFFLGVRNTTESSDRHHQYFDPKNLTEEASEYGDIIQADFVDSYRNLSLKVATMLHWARTNCREARYLLKVDVDTFVNLPLLLELLDHMSVKYRYFVLGHGAQIPQMNAKPVARTGKWGVSVETYPFDYYPVYLHGHSYVISGDAVDALLFGYHHMPTVEIEDAFFTGILRKTLGINSFRCWQFAAGDDVRVTLRCFLLENISISQTGFKRPTGMYEIWDKIISGNTSVKCSGKHLNPNMI